MQFVLVESEQMVMDRSGLNGEMFDCQSRDAARCARDEGLADWDDIDGVRDDGYAQYWFSIELRQ